MVLKSYFLTYAAPMSQKARRGFRIIVYSRFDEILDPESDATTLCIDSHVQEPFIDLSLYNHTNNSIAGVHYDPVFLRRSPSSSTEHPSKIMKTSENATVNNDDEDFQYSDLSNLAFNQISLGQCESDICSTLTEADAVHMLQVSRSSGQDLSKTHSGAAKNGSQTYPLHSEYPFIPELLFALLMSVYQSPGELSRVLQQDWINDWNGWK